MYLSLSQAAAKTGKSKSVLSKLLKNGTISYISKDNNGYRIDPSELERVFPERPENPKKEQEEFHKNNDENALIISKIQAELDKAILEKNLYKTQLEKSEEREKDLSSKLDKAQSTIERQTYLISDMREKTIEKPVERPKRFFGMFSRSNS